MSPSLLVNTAAQAYFFRATGEGVPSWYGGLFDPALLTALSKADPQGRTSSWILRGDLLLHNLAMKTRKVERAGGRGGTTMGYDYDLIKTVIWDFIDAASSQWHRMDFGQFFDVVRQHAVHCLVLPTLPVVFREAIDTNLRASRRAKQFYIGSIEVDLGNPIQTHLLIRSLVKDAIVHGGSIILEQGYEGFVNSTFAGAQRFKPNGVKDVPCCSLSSQIGPIPTAPTSARGRQSLERYQGKRAFTLQERVLELLGASWDLDKHDFRFEALADDNPVNEATVPAPKFVDYLLNPNHRENGGKAKFFMEVLGITRDDWRYLAAQLHHALDEADITDMAIKTWQGGGLGVSFNAVLSLVGLNGRTVTVKTNWIMEPGQVPRLSTIVPEQAGEPVGGKIPPVVPRQLIGERKWEALFDLADAAGQEAYATQIPTPLFLEGYGAYSEGACGWALVNVPDARRNFARWLLKSGKAYRGYRGGATMQVSSPTQSVERAYAYARAFARVLDHNGVDCSIERHVD